MFLYGWFTDALVGMLRAATLRFPHVWFASVGIKYGHRDLARCYLLGIYKVLLLISKTSKLRVHPSEAKYFVLLRLLEFEYN
jgi:hypothetical protein